MKRAKRTPTPSIGMKIAADKALRHEVPREQHVRGEKAAVGGIRSIFCISLVQGRMKGLCALRLGLAHLLLSEDPAPEG
jgi:hypothetical protein